MQVLSVYRSPSANCINVDIGYEELLTAMSAREENPVQQAIQQVIQLFYPHMSTTKRVIKATLCLSEEEYEILQKPTVGDEIDFSVTSEGVVTIRFVKR